MNGRWTMQDLKAIEDLTFIQAILNERRGNLNPYAPLSLKIKEINGKIDRRNIFQCPMGKVFNEESSRCIKQRK